MGWGGYKTGRWERLRARVLRRDGYRCREAARYGKVVEATTVHHVWPVEDYPEWAWEAWNLIALSTQAHNAMHDRATGKLTERGESWRRRTMKEFNQGGARTAKTARLIAGNGCTLGEARACAVSGGSNQCRDCGWLASEVERRRKLPLHRNRDGRWQMKIGVRKS